MVRTRLGTANQRVYNLVYHKGDPNRGRETVLADLSRARSRKSAGKPTDEEIVNAEPRRYRTLPVDSRELQRLPPGAPRGPAAELQIASR